MSFNIIWRFSNIMKMKIIKDQSRPCVSCSQSPYTLSDAEMNSLLEREYVQVLFGPEIKAKLPPIESDIPHKYITRVKPRRMESDMSSEPKIDVQLQPPESAKNQSTSSIHVESKNDAVGLGLGLGITVTKEYGFEEGPTGTIAEIEGQSPRRPLPPTPTPQPGLDGSSEGDSKDETMKFLEDMGSVYLEDILELEREHPDDEVIGEDEDMAGVDLEELLELERDQPDDLNLDGNAPNTIIASSSTQIYSPAPRSPRPQFKEWRTRGSLEEGQGQLDEQQDELPDLEMLFTHTMLTYPEYCLRNHPTLGQYRARDPSRLRKCWTRITLEELDSMDWD
jgi:hypothetical protein